MKVPNPQPNNTLSYIYRWRSSVHYFHGTLIRNDGDLCLFGHYRLPPTWVNRILGAINAGLLLGTTLLFVALAALGVELLTGAETEKLITFIALLPFAFAIALLGLVLSLLWSLFGIIFKFLDRLARAEAYRLLTEICGSPATPPNNQH